LVQLAEFYQLGGYQYWGRMHQTEPVFASDSDSSDSSDYPSNLSRAEAVRQYPEAAHQALAATLGLVYYKIRNEVGEGHNAHVSRPPKRQQEDMPSVSSGSKPKPVKMARRPNNLSPTALHRLITGPSLESKSMASDESDKLGWNAISEVSDETMSKLRGIVSEEVGVLLRALERGRIRLKPGRSDRPNLPAESRTSVRNGNYGADGAQDDDAQTLPDTVPTEIVSLSDRTEGTEEHEPDLPDTESDATSPLS
jgi:hypothetical protein